jgi:hypothetical protein
VHYIFVNGIFTVPGEHNWTDAAVKWIQTNAPEATAEEFEYFTTAFWRNATDWWLGRQLAKRIRTLVGAGAGLVIVAHSNGADVVLDALRRCGYPKISQLHLLSPACAEDCEVSGLAKVDAQMITGDMLGHGIYNIADFKRQRTAIGVAQHDPACAVVIRRLQAVDGKFGIGFVAVEKMLGVIQRLALVFHHVLDGLADHAQVFLF